MIYEIKLLPRAEKFYKKIKNKALRSKIEEMFDAIVENPFIIGKELTGNYKGIRAIPFKHAKVDYRIAYVMIEECIQIDIIKVGKREGFYDDL